VSDAVDAAEMSLAVRAAVSLLVVVVVVVVGAAAAALDGDGGACSRPRRQFSDAASRTVLADVVLAVAFPPPTA